MRTAASTLKFGQFRLLNCTSRLILPTNKFIKFFITSTDVIHSFSIPALFIKVDACPGKLNEFNTVVNRAGVLYGQCSEICGTNHSFMPIVVQAIPGYKFFENYNFLYITDTQYDFVFLKYSLENIHNVFSALEHYHVAKKSKLKPEEEGVIQIL